MSDLPPLQELGFSDYEGKAYLALLEAGECNGYALAKAAGIPRANVYAVADKLVQRGAATRVERPDGVRYLAVPPARMLDAIATRHARVLAGAREALARRQRGRAPTEVFNLRGDELLEHARRLVDAATGSLKVGIQPREAAALATSLREARERGVAITTLCMEACSRECGGCQGAIHRYPLAPEGARWLVMVADDATALVGELGDGPARGLATGQPLVVKVVAAYIEQSLTLAVLGGDLAGRFEGLLSAEARGVLDGLDPARDFIARMRELSDATPPAA